MIPKAQSLTVNTAKANARRTRPAVTITDGSDSEPEATYSSNEKAKCGARVSGAPSITVGYLVLFVTIVFFVIGSYAILFSVFFPHTGVMILDALARDTHYKYFVVLLVPTTAYFVIANWVGWQYYRNS